MSVAVFQRVFERLPANRLPDDNAPMATRRPPNGQAPEPPLRVESREELVYLLGEACELEHGLLCEYLYAQFSLKRSVAEGVTSEQLARIRRGKPLSSTSSSRRCCT